MHLVLGHRRVDVTTRSLVMGVLDGRSDAVIDQADRMVTEGADLLDVVARGPLSEVGEAEELDRVVPAVAALKARFDVPIVVDSARASVAREAYAAGAVVGRDTSGFADPHYLPVALAAGAAVVAVHVCRGGSAPGSDSVAEVHAFLARGAALAEAAGVPRERIMVDAGLGAGKAAPQSVVLLRASDQLVALGYPVVLSVACPREPTYAAQALAVMLGCRILRADDVRGARRVADTIAAVLEAA